MFDFIMPIIYPNFMSPEEYFKNISGVQKKYESMKAFFQEKMSAEKIASNYGYSVSTVYTLTKTFRKQLKEYPNKDPFFIMPKKGRPFKKNKNQLDDLIVSLRKKNLSVPDIKSMIDTHPRFDEISESYIDYLLKEEGFSRLPRRNNFSRERKELPEKLKAQKSEMIHFVPGKFSSSDIGILCFLPIVRKYKIDTLIQKSLYPQTKVINRYCSIMAFIALKLSNVRRYTKDDLWCMDRGLGLFAGLNVLPKAAWFTSYSSRVTKEMNLSFLQGLHKIWIKEGLLGNTVNLDFTTIPYWGESDHLENNWSGKRNKALSSISAILAQDPDSGIIDYGDTNVMHKNENAVVLEFLDFYRSGNPNDSSLKYLVFDSKFTCYQNLAKLDVDKKVKFLTIRRRGKNIVQRLNKIPKKEWKKIRVDCAGNKKRTLKVLDEKIFLKDYGKEIRQIAITGHGKIKPALVITNDFDEEVEIIIRKYARRWLVEKAISEQIEFFHLNRVSSSMVIKVDFDLIMSITAHNIYRLLARELERYENISDQTIYEEFIRNAGEVDITEDEVKIFLKKKRTLPAMLTAMQNFAEQKYLGLKNKKLIFFGSTTS
jgi:transposase